jgi:hypothetical protein
MYMPRALRLRVFSAAFGGRNGTDYNTKAESSETHAHVYHVDSAVASPNAAWVKRCEWMTVFDIGKLPENCNFCLQRCLQAIGPYLSPSSPPASDSLARRINHRSPGNMEFVEDESSPYAQLELIEPVRAGEQLFVDYGPSYPYSAHRFAR